MAVGKQLYTSYCTELFDTHLPRKLPSYDSANYGYALKAGQLTYDCRYSTMHGMPVTGGRGFRGLKPLWYNGVPP